jgi:hypothetical protein
MTARGERRKKKQRKFDWKNPKRKWGKNIFYFFALLLFPVRRITIPSYLAIRLSTAGRIKKGPKRKKVWTT